MSRDQIQYAIIGVGLCIAGWMLWPRGPENPPEVHQLAEQLGNAAPTDPAAKVTVIEQLARGGEQARPVLAATLRQDASPQVRAAAAAALGAVGDQESMPALLQAMDDPDPLVRARASGAVRRIMGVNYYFRAEAEPAERRRVIATIRQELQRFSSNSKK